MRSYCFFQMTGAKAPESSAALITFLKFALCENECLFWFFFFFFFLWFSFAEVIFWLMAWPLYCLATVLSVGHARTLIRVCTQTHTQSLSHTYVHIHTCKVNLNSISSQLLITLIQPLSNAHCIFVTK